MKFCIWAGKTVKFLLLRFLRIIVLLLLLILKLRSLGYVKRWMISWLLLSKGMKPFLMISSFVSLLRSAWLAHLFSVSMSKQLMIKIYVMIKIVLKLLSVFVFRRENEFSPDQGKDSSSEVGLSWKRSVIGACIW